MAELTVVAMACAAVGRSVSGMDGILGSTGDLAFWWVSLGWRACAPWPAGVPDGVLGDLALGDAGVPDGLALPAMSPASVGFVACGLTVELGAPGVLGDSGVGVLALGIGGSWWGSTAGVWPDAS
ncbi:hypothetical protein [Mycobacteroides abscessus]|uniref:hypothetical protein n=1 Tax=Mycobacteroides abscessus TaxID=36809 RepID=UPI001F158E96|nr:hypothetical protein [Mycobacteroides abscessus]